MVRDGPGLLLRDILADTPEIAAAASVMARLSPDVVLLTGFDHDLQGHALAAFADRLAAEGAEYPHRFAYAPNAGMAPGVDRDGDGRVGTPRDGQGYGEFAGQGGMALLSRLAVDAGDSHDHSAFLWGDLPGALLEPGQPPAGVLQDQRLSSTAHWDLALTLPDGRRMRLWAWHATPPVFGPEGRNARRNHDEAAFWLHYLNGALPVVPEPAPFVLLGDANLDPVDGDGLPEALLALLAHPRLVDPEPRSAGAPETAARDGGANTRHRGDPALDTADWPDGEGRPGNLRVDYVLPSSDWQVLGAGVWWPAEGPEAEEAATASRHRMVWVDVALP